MRVEFFQCAFSAALFWSAGSLLLYFGSARRRAFGQALVLIGIAPVAFFIGHLWVELGHAPLRTLGETRLWYSALLSITGVAICFYWKMLWVQSYSLAMAGLFLGLNALRPEVMERALMPALQSPWFVPHVVVYLEAYALLTAAALIAARALARPSDGGEEILLQQADRMALLGYGFLTLGLLFGALWAKTAWGHYWSWDPKETWALLTWLCYLIYIHVRYRYRRSAKLAFGLLIGGYVAFMICWFGVAYLPASSMHSY